MHLSMILIALSMAIFIRIGWPMGGSRSSGSCLSWAERWNDALMSLLLPPLILLATTVAVISMGPQGQMLGLSVGWLGYSMAIAVLSLAIVNLLYRIWQGWRSLQHIQQTCDRIEIQGQTGYLLHTKTLFAAQVGFWQPLLVVSQGLVDQLDPEHLRAVLTHENAHTEYRDTFWFFWLGWFQQFTSWLPNTHRIWQELLLLRELRADQHASQWVDPLVLAESLLQVVQSPLTEVYPEWTAFAATPTRSRLEERIDLLLANSHQSFQTPKSVGIGLLAATLIPLMTVWLHGS